MEVWKPMCEIVNMLWIKCVAESWFMVFASSFILPTLKQIASTWEMLFSGKQSNETSQWQFDLILQASAT